ncbi:tetratricopeptide repeat protein [Micromonospora sp. NPDC049559]|uniref:ATP-binding protein n=1 Tax=Micromonospora sp. NPDC049559 TaxID=3155923 RepID=UPI003444E5C2
MVHSFGALLRESRRNAGLTQEQLAARASISSQAVGALERGTRRFPHQHTITRLADALGLDGERRDAFTAAAVRPSSPPAAPTGEPHRGALPRQLPPPAALTGRDQLVDEIAARLRQTGAVDRHTVLLVGAGGIGKTALALAVGHRLAEEFSDGQLFADLRGAHEQPVDPHVVVGRFLRALGVRPAEVPADPDERLASYRSLLAGRRMLLVLDDATAEEQVRPLLPPAEGCATIVTSRRHLGALLGAARWTVPALSTEDAPRLLARIAGAARIADEPAAAAVVAACGYSPLAICVAAGRLAVRPHWSVAELGRRLTAEHGRLDALSVGDLDVRASIGLSYQALSAPQRRLFRRLALHWAPDWPAWVADQLCGGRAEPMLDELVNVHLVEPVGVDAVGQQRFRLHDLIAEFARERARAEERSADLDRITEGLLRAWLALAGVADDAFGHGYDYGAGLPADPAPPRAAPAVGVAPAAWFETERGTLVAAVGRASRLGHAEIAGALALRLAGFLRVRGHRDDCLGTLREALGVRRSGEPDRLRLRLAQTLFSTLLDHDLDAEMPHLTRDALASARALGEPDLLIRALTQAGLYAKRRGRLGEAADFYERSLAACDGSTPLLTSTALSSVAAIYAEAGRPRDALPLSERAVAIQRAAGAPVMTALRLLTHADVLADLERTAEAEVALAEAVELCRAAGHQAALAYAELRLGELATRQGRWDIASTLVGRALAMFDELGDAGSTAYAARSLGDLALARGHLHAALAPFYRALRTWQRLRLPLEAARVHARLDVTLRALGEPTAAQHRSTCDEILRDLGLDERALRLRSERDPGPSPTAHHRGPSLTATSNV